MKSFKIMLGIVFMLSATLSVMAVESEYDLRFVQIESEQAGVALIDIEMRAADSDKEFNLAEQNFRFSFNEDAVLPYYADQPSVTIEQELTVSGQVAQSFYAPHHVNGSEENIISYNVELLGGEGLEITADEWTKVGRLAFQLKSVDATLILTWHRVDDFPPTYISERINDKLIQVNEGNIEDFASMTVDVNDPLAVNDAIHLFPNPTTNATAVNLTINSAKIRGAGQLFISDALGRTISTQTIVVEQGVQNYNVNVKALSAGTYRINIQTATWQSASKSLVVIEK